VLGGAFLFEARFYLLKRLMLALLSQLDFFLIAAYFSGVRLIDRKSSLVSIFRSSSSSYLTLGLFSA